MSKLLLLFYYFSNWQQSISRRISSSSIRVNDEKSNDTPHVYVFNRTRFSGIFSRRILHFTVHIAYICTGLITTKFNIELINPIK